MFQHHNFNYIICQSNLSQSCSPLSRQYYVFSTLPCLHVDIDSRMYLLQTIYFLKTLNVSNFYPLNLRTSDIINQSTINNKGSYVVDVNHVVEVVTWTRPWCGHHLSGMMFKIIYIWYLRFISKEDVSYTYIQIHKLIYTRFCFIF